MKAKKLKISDVHFWEINQKEKQFYKDLSW